MSEAVKQWDMSGTLWRALESQQGKRDAWLRLEMWCARFWAEAAADSRAAQSLARSHFVDMVGNLEAIRSIRELKSGLKHVPDASLPRSAVKIL